MEKTVILRFYEDITDRLEGSREILIEIISTLYDAMLNDSYYCIWRHYRSNICDKGGYYCREATMEWEAFLEMLWDMHNLHDYEKVFIWVSW